MDSISTLVGQRGRFTLDPPLLTHIFTVPSMNTTIPITNAPEPLPDADLDGGLGSQSASIYGMTDSDSEEEQKRWEVYVKSGSIGFDFRGSSGVRGGWRRERM